MSRRNGNGERQSEHQPWTQEEAQAIEQGLDLQMVENVKELLANLWKTGRITLDARTAGENALSAAYHAVGHPLLKNIGLMEGSALSQRQWFAKQEESNREF